MKGKKIITVISIVCLLSILLAIPAFATVTESSGDGFALYGGVKLPDIDSIWSSYEDSYPNAMIFTGVIEGSVYYSLGLTAVELDYNGSYLGTDGQYSVVTAMLVYDSSVAELIGIPVGEWSSMGESVNNGYAVQGTAVWSSYDVVNITDNSVYFPASEPVSLDGYNVIEWDGDTTGLDSASPNVGWWHVSSEMPTASQVSGGWLAVSNGGYAPIGAGYVEPVEWESGSGWYILGMMMVTFEDGLQTNGLTLPLCGTYFMRQSQDIYLSLLAYRSVEAPPDEGGGDEDDPQPPCGG